jgi:RNA polymerase sigma-70 factor (ECF subfamily)
VAARLPFADIPGSPAGVFATTHWSVVVHAGDADSPDAAKAMERLCQTYWYPLYVFVRRKGNDHEDACDLTQAFFATFLEKHYLRSVDAARGKFRTFLLTSLTHFLANEWDKARAQRRGGGCQVLSLDGATAEERYGMEPVDVSTPETMFERQWAEVVMSTTLDRLAKEMEAKRFEILKGFLLDDKGSISYYDAALALGCTVPAVTSAIHRMRTRLRALLYDEIAQTVEHPGAVEPEIRHLLQALTH